MREGCDTARVPKAKQVVLLGGHTPSRRPEGLIHKAVEHLEEMQSHAQEKVISSTKSESTDPTESSINFEPIRRIQTLAENVRDESISLDEVRPILRNISQEMVHGVIEGSEEKSSKFLEILEQNQQVTLIGEEMKSNISESSYTEQVNRQNSILSEISAKELAEVFLNDLTDNVSVYLEDILDELIQNNSNNNDNNDLQS
ncbi:unnamed protein product [Schistosoma margrebowiei]|uniref:Uncharacterized protein n=1 Tax=Schistosoma margrebowiei TaxID=48269 RepID=A0A183MJK7_9TREM|nr:unnamed protein product [Schistosoma margrebowiei]